MSKIEVMVLALVSAACIFAGWTGEVGWVYNFALVMGGIVCGVVLVFALDERVGGSDE